MATVGPIPALILLHIKCATKRDNAELAPVTPMQTDCVLARRMERVVSWRTPSDLTNRPIPLNIAYPEWRGLSMGHKGQAAPTIDGACIAPPRQAMSPSAGHPCECLAPCGAGPPAMALREVHPLSGDSARMPR